MFKYCVPSNTWKFILVWRLVSIEIICRKKFKLSWRLSLAKLFNIFFHVKLTLFDKFVSKFLGYDEGKFQKDLKSDLVDYTTSCFFMHFSHAFILVLSSAGGVNPAGPFFAPYPLINLTKPKTSMSTCVKIRKKNFMKSYRLGPKILWNVAHSNVLVY